MKGRRKGTDGAILRRGVELRWEMRASEEGVEGRSAWGRKEGGKGER